MPPVNNKRKYEVPENEKGYDPELLEWFNELKDSFDPPVSLPDYIVYVRSNKRATGNQKHTNGGYFTVLRNGHWVVDTGIGISWEYRDRLGEEEIKSILKHELLHAWLFQNGKAHSDRSWEFKYYAGKFNVELHCSVLPPINYISEL